MKRLFTRAANTRTNEGPWMTAAAVGNPAAAGQIFNAVTNKVGGNGRGPVRLPLVYHHHNRSTPPSVQNEKCVFH